MLSHDLVVWVYQLQDQAVYAKHCSSLGLSRNNVWKTINRNLSAIHTAWWQHVYHNHTLCPLLSLESVIKKNRKRNRTEPEGQNDIQWVSGGVHLSNVLVKGDTDGAVASSLFHRDPITHALMRSESESYNGLR